MSGRKPTGFTKWHSHKSHKICKTDNLKGGILISYWKLLKTVLASAFGFLCYLLGGLDQMLILLLLFIVFDYISGVLKAIHKRELSSAVGFNGIVRKVLMLMIVAVAFGVEKMIGNTFPLRELTISFFVANEGISILENAAQSGVKLPKKLTEILQQMHKKHE